MHVASRTRSTPSTPRAALASMRADAERGAALVNAQLQLVAVARSPSGSLPAPVRAAAPFTRVTLVHVPHQFVVSLRFGRPVRELPLDGTRRIAAFLPGARFARLRWE